MKTNKSLRNFTLLAGSSLLAISSVSAQTAVNWEGDSTDNLWSNSANWFTAPANDITTNIANFNLPTYGGNPVFAPTVGTATSIAGITIGASNGTMILTNTAALTLGTSGITMASGAGAFTINGLLTLGGVDNVAHTWTNNSSNLLTINSNLALGGSGSRRPIIVTGTGNTLISGNIDGNETNTNFVTKNGTGTLEISGQYLINGNLTVNNGTLTLSGNQVQVAATRRYRVGSSGNTAILNITNGSHQPRNEFTVGNGGTGTVNQSNSTVTFATSTIGLTVGQGAQGTYNLDSGTLSTSYTSTTAGVILGSGANGNATFNLNGGALSLTDSALQIGRRSSDADNTTALFNQTSGTATVGNLTMGGNAATSSGGTQTLTVSGGTFTATTFANLAEGNTNVAVINIGNGISSTADVTLPNLPTLRGTSSTATLNLDGGILRNSGTGTFITGLNNVFIKAGGANINTSLNSTTIAQNLQTDAVSTGGGLTKSGTNTLTLTGTNTYTGDTTVSAGTLTLADASSTLFNIGASEVNNAILGAGTVNLDGTFFFDLTNAGTNNGDFWNIVDVDTLSETYGSTFDVDSSLGAFTDNAGVWTLINGGNTWTFTESTGNLSVAVIPEPKAALLGAIGVLLLFRRRR